MASTTTKKTSNFKTAVAVLGPLLTFCGKTRVFVAYITFPGASSMAFLAPAQVPGPMSRYCDGVQGPKKHLSAKPGSLKKSLTKFGLQPISLANSSQ